jgi:predicted dithiol-disulfide oxidoreductase (DUF899 family)
MSNVESSRSIDLPQIVSSDDWLNARKELLIKEKALTHYRDAVNAERRRLPMVKIKFRKFFRASNLFQKTKEK